MTESEHPFSKLNDGDLRAIVSEPESERADNVHERLAGKPYESLDEMHADDADPHGEELQAAFEAAQDENDL